MFSRIIVESKELSLIPDFKNLDSRTLNRRKKKILLFVGKEDAQPLTVFDLCKYFGIEETKMRQILTGNYHQTLISQIQSR